VKAEAQGCGTTALKPIRKTHYSAANSTGESRQPNSLHCSGEGSNTRCHCRHNTWRGEGVKVKVLLGYFCLADHTVFVYRWQKHTDLTICLQSTTVWQKPSVKTDADTGSRAINSNNEAVPICMQRNYRRTWPGFSTNSSELGGNVLGIHLMHSTQRWMSALTKCSRLDRVWLPAEPSENIKFE